jgi:choline kinase
MKPLEVVILAAEKGSRLGFGLPKALLKLDSGGVLLDYQLDKLNEEFNYLQISVVVGYKSELFSIYSTRVMLLYHPLFDSTNTARSLTLALESVKKNPMSNGLMGTFTSMVRHENLSPVEKVA